MNSIAAVVDLSDYPEYGSFLNIQIDGEFIDEMLDRLNPGLQFKGLVSALSYEFELDIHTSIVWRRIIPAVGMESACPIIMCPDDRDFTCSLLVAKIKNDGYCINWEKIGLDRSRESHVNPELVGANVEWLDQPRNLTFDIQQYVRAIDAFKINLKPKQI
jgi:hypothetical protein